jgi:Domain of unknown function (DUF4157)
VQGEHEHDTVRDNRRKDEPEAVRVPLPGAGWASTVGNRALQKLVGQGGVQRSGTGPAALDETVARAIHAKRGTGRPLEAGAQRDLSAAMDHDFSDVNVHTDAEADRLNRAVSAEAFTTGKDVFFREGKYDPASNEGRKLIAHELTHVIQQRGAPPTQDLTVSDPNDASEQQASAVASDVASPPAQAAASVSRHAAPEEQVSTSSVAREAAEDEEEAPAPEAADHAEAPAEEEEEKQPA